MGNVINIICIVQCMFVTASKQPFSPGTEDRSVADPSCFLVTGDGPRISRQNDAEFKTK